MSITSIRKTRLPFKGGPGAVGVRFDPADNLLKIHDGVSEKLVALRAASVTSKTAAFTVVAPTDNGKIFKLALLASFAVTLPAIGSSAGQAPAGFRATFVNALAATSGVGYSLSPAATDSIKYGVDNKDLINTTATDVLGDLVTVVSDGVDSWIVTEEVGIWAKEV